MKRFWSKVNKTSGCWLWIGCCDKKEGYGRFSLDGKNRTAHLVSLRLAGVKIPRGKVADHKCRVRNCVRPSHLRLVSQRQNILENSLGVAARHAAKTHCKRGHRFTEKNTRINASGWRRCRTCINDIRRARYAELGHQ